VEQARALGRTKLLKETDFTAFYCSDLGRAVETTQLILSELDRDTTYIRLEKRLREMAKGAREGFSKITTHAQAMAQRQKDDGDSPIPFQETEDEAWQRIHDFVLGLLTRSHSTEGACDETTDVPSTNRSRNVFVLSHSGILRVFLQRLIGKDRLYKHPNARFDKSGRFYLPNTSVTILDVELRNEAEIPEEQKKGNYSLNHNFDVTIVQLTWDEHLGSLKTSSVAFAE
jgi:broad specificity phosphatase PhoE